MSRRILLYVASQDEEASAIEKKANSLLKRSGKDIQAILKKYKVRPSCARTITKQKISVKYKGAGLDPATVALAVSLVPLIIAVRPLLMPWSAKMAKVAEKIALDTWDVVRMKLWSKKHIRLEERSRKKPRKR